MESPLVLAERNLSTRLRSAAAAVAIAMSIAVASPRVQADERADEEVLRVCSDPDNMPLSNRAGDGYENRIAAALAAHLGRRIEYTFFPQRMGFVRNTLRKQDPTTGKFKCDVIIGVPANYELTATTQPYMRSTYALVFPTRGELDRLQSAEDLLALSPQVLQSYRIGVFAQSPGVDWLLRAGLLERAVVYPQQSGDPAEHPASIIERDLERGNIDVAIVWGPIAGYLIREHAAFPAWRAVPFKRDPRIKFDYEIAMGVRFGEKQWKEVLDQWIATHRSAIEKILAEYRIPLLDANGAMIADFGSSDAARDGSVPKQIPLQLQPKQ